MASPRARHLRQNMTEAERALWAQLRRRQAGGSRFRRQAPVGNYIVDFLCLETRLIVEVDGGQHAARTEQDPKRTRWLNSQGFRVIRFWNTEILENMDGVMETILRTLAEGRTPP